MTRTFGLLAMVMIALLLAAPTHAEEAKTPASFAVAKNTATAKNAQLASWPGYYYYGVYYGSYRWRYQPYYTFYANPWFDYGAYYSPYAYAWPTYGYGYYYAPYTYSYTWPHYGAYGYTYYGPVTYGY